MQLQENEVVMLFLSVGVLIFILLNLKEIKRLPYPFLLLSAFFSLLVAWVSTLVEEFGLHPLFNTLEHLAYALSAVILFFWCWFMLKQDGESL